MRATHYYIVLMVLSVLGLLVSGVAGILRFEAHLLIALPTAMTVVAAHSLVILFVLICSRVMREAIQNCGLSEDLLGRSNEFFRRASGFGLALLGAFSIVAAGVLGYSERAFGFPVEVHIVAGIVAACLTFIAIPFELQTLAHVGQLYDEVASALARDDAARAERGLPPVDSQVPKQRDSLATTGLFIVIAPWLVYLYLVLIVWQARFDRVSLHPWLEISAAGLVVWLLGRRGGVQSDGEPT